MITTAFSIINASGSYEKGALLISPQYSPISYSGSIVGAQTIYLQDNGNPVTASLVPTAYMARLNGLYTGLTEFNFDLSNVTDGSSVDAANYLVNYNNEINNNATASYALFAITALTSSVCLGYPNITDQGGDVGISTNNPQYTLDVNGDINFTGTLYQHGSPFSGGSTQQVYGGNYANPINNITPTNTGSYAIYYQDGYTNTWYWSVVNQQWYQFSN